jgi:hypothetical protein
MLSRQDLIVRVLVEGGIDQYEIELANDADFRESLDDYAADIITLCPVCAAVRAATTPSPMLPPRPIPMCSNSNVVSDTFTIFTAEKACPGKVSAKNSEYRGQSPRVHRQSCEILGYFGREGQRTNCTGVARACLQVQGDPLSAGNDQTASVPEANRAIL